MENGIFKIGEVDPNFLKEISDMDLNDYYSDIINKENNIETLKVVSNLRENIISWYPFKPNAVILEIGADYGQVTKELCNNADKVYSFEINSEKRAFIKKRNKNIENLIIIESLESLEEKVDYITLIGLENITENPKSLLKEVKKYLKEDGIILLATDNKFGIKYFATQEPNGETISNLVGKKLYSLETLQKIIKESGFEALKVYFPMTDYKFPNTIFTNDEKIAQSNLSRNIIYNQKDTIKFYEQNEVYNKLLSEDNFSMEMFANSFFMEIFNNGIVADNNIRMVTFSNMRKDKYKIKTIIKNDYVYKYPGNKKSVGHIKRIKENIDIMKKVNIKTVDTYDKERIISKYTKALTLDKVIINTIKDDKEKALEIIKRYRNQIYEKFEVGTSKKNVFDKYNINYSSDVISNMKFCKYGLWDLIFQNCFFIEDEFYYYDQEWREENLPVEFILYRAIKYFSEIREYIDIKSLYEILNISEDMIKLFDELDDKIQDEIRDELMWKIHRQGINVNELRIQKLTDNHNMNLMKIELDRLTIENSQLREVNNSLNEQLKKVHKTVLWKITKPIRVIQNRLDRKE